MLKLNFLGAITGVTGSKTLLTYRGSDYLIDCGLMQGELSLEKEVMQDLPTELSPSKLSAVFLTHAHADHSGMLPRLIRKGFHGPIYCSQETSELVIPLLEDSAKIHVEAMKSLRDKHPKHAKKYLPLYDLSEVETLKSRLHIVQMNKVLRHHDLEFSFHPNAHILGSCSVRFQTHPKTLCMSGDLGRFKPVLELPPMSEIKPSDIVVMESTYGNRSHQGDPKRELTVVLQKAKDQSRVVMVAAFALARTQSLIVLLDEIMNENPKLQMPILLDSPLGIKMNQIYERHIDKLARDPEILKRALGRVKALEHMGQREGMFKKEKPPFITLASSGMLSGGRILALLEHFGEDPNTTLVLTGFQAPGTLGRVIASGERELSFDTFEGRKTLTLKSDVANIGALSAHADREDLIKWAQMLVKENGEIYLNHGDDEAKEELVFELTHKLSAKTQLVDLKHHELKWD